jgi:eukaryotic-like serine/threonine-protein kinase
MTNAEHHLMTLFAEALEFTSPPERAAYLDRACGNDQALRQHLEALLGAHAQVGRFLDPQAAVAGATSSAAGKEIAEASVDNRMTVPQAGTEGPGTQIGPYKLLEPIGEGGMGTVWMAQQTEPVKRLVALKLIKAGMDSKQVIARFEAERQALALMDHPNIARVLDAGTTGAGRPYFVMDLVKGVPITRYCDEHRLSVRERLGLFVPVCQAVQHAHQKGIIHRDLKPSNVIIALYDGTPVPKVIDFGVAKAAGQPLTEKTLVTGLGALVGTLEYMSPEQAELNNLDVDTRSDVYSLGVLLYELLTGTTPLGRERAKGAGLLESLRIIREEETPRPSTRLSTAEGLPGLAANRGTEPTKLTRLVRGELDWIVMKALEKDRSRRYETANGFALDVQRYLADEAVQACPPSAGYRLRKFVRRNRPQVIAASLVFLALIAGVIGTTVGLLEARRQAGIAWDEASAKESARAEEARQRASAEANERKAVAAAEQEQQARVQIASQLKQIELANGTVFDVFAEFDVRKFKASGEPVEAVLARKLVEAGRTLDAKAIADPLVLAKVRNRLGRTLLSLGYPRDAIELFLAARATLSEKLGPDHPDTLTSMNDLAVGYDDAGKPDLALPLHEETLKLRKARLGPDHPSTLTSMNNLATGYEAVGKLDLALPLYEETLKLRKARLGPDHPHTLISMDNLAGGYEAAGKPGLAQPLYEETLKRMKAKLPPDHPDTLVSMNNLAMCYRAARKFDLALPLYEETLKLKKARLGPDHPSTLNSMVNLAGGYLAAGKPDLALPLYKELLELRKARLGPDHPYTLMSMNNLGNCYWLLRRLDKLVPLFEELVPLQEKKFGRAHADTQMTVANLGVSYKDTGRVAEAIPLLEEAYTASKKHATLRWVGTELLDAYAKAGEPAKAAKLIDDLLADARQTLPKDSPRLAGQLVQYGLALLETKGYAKAEPLLRECLAIREKTQPDAWTTFNTQSMLGGALLGLKKYKDAEPLLLKGYEGMKAREKTIPKAGETRIPEALDRLIELYTVTNKPDEAKKWRVERAKYLPEQAPPPRALKP